VVLEVGASVGNRVEAAIATITTRMHAVVTPAAEQRGGVSKRVFMAAPFELGGLHLYRHAGGAKADIDPLWR
jgi:hypothetical protein